MTILFIVGYNYTINNDYPSANRNIHTALGIQNDMPQPYGKSTLTHTPLIVFLTPISALGSKVLSLS